MSIPQKSTRNKSLVGYLPAVLKKNKSGWLVEYYVENPFTKDFVRKQIKLSHIINLYQILLAPIRQDFQIMFANYIFHFYKNLFRCKITH